MGWQNLCDSRNDSGFFAVDIRTISRYLEQHGEELSANGYQVLRGKK